LALPKAKNQKKIAQIRALDFMMSLTIVKLMAKSIGKKIGTRGVVVVKSNFDEIRFGKMGNIMALYATIKS
jgi:hypothetical protein